VPWRPQGNTRVLLEQVREIFSEYEDHLPLTARQIFYRLVGAYDYGKSDALYDRLIYMLGRARRAEVIPFDWLRDDGITVVQGRWFAEAADFWDHVGGQARRYERDKQTAQPVYIEIWTEATGMLPQLAAVADRYSVPVYSAAGGFSGLCGVRSIVDHALQRNVPTVVLHVGDFDPHGEDIFRAITEDAAAFLRVDRVIGTQRLIPERVALTSEQVEQHDLPTDPIEKSRSKSHESMNERWRKRHGNRTCQLEALRPDVLAGIVRSAIERHLDLELLAHHEDVERAERIQLLHALPSGEAA
jgi:hypothetical protein